MHRYRERLSSQSQGGFTLVELIAVMVIVAVLGALGSAYFLQYVESQKAIQARIDLLSRSRLSINLIARELENALPNSVRVTNAGQCVEFIPMLGGGILANLPATDANGAAGRTQLDVTAYSIDRGVARAVVLGAVDASDIYQGAALAALATPLAEGQGAGVINLAQAAVFAQSSSSLRLFFVALARAFCVYQGGLYEYRDIALSPSGFSPSAAGILVDADVDSRNGGFSLQAGAYDNGAQLNIDLVFRQGDTQWPSNDRIFIRNVP